MSEKMNTKLNIERKVSDARTALDALVADFEEKNAAFQKVRQTYAEALERKVVLNQKITDFEVQIQAATIEFKSEFEAANYEHTPGVKKILARRNDAQAMLEEAQAALPKVEQEILLLRMEGGPAAKQLVALSDAIKFAQIEQHIREAMTAIPQGVKDALALAGKTINGRDATKFAWSWLAEVAKESGTAPTLPTIADLSMAPYKSEDFNWRQLQVDSAKSKLSQGVPASSIATPKRIPNIFLSPAN